MTRAASLHARGVDAGERRPAYAVRVRAPLRSRVFPGLRRAAPALLSGDLAAALRELQAGIDADEHRRFAARLAEPS